MSCRNQNVYCTNDTFDDLRLSFNVGHYGNRNFISVAFFFSAMELSVICFPLFKAMQYMFVSNVITCCYS